MKLTPVAERVILCELPWHLQRTALYLALHGNDDGDSIFPTVARVARLVKRSERTVRRDLSVLIRLGVLVPGLGPAGIVVPENRWRTGGRSTPYRIVSDALQAERLRAQLSAAAAPPAAAAPVNNAAFHRMAAAARLWLDTNKPPLTAAGQTQFEDAVRHELMPALGIARDAGTPARASSSPALDARVVDSEWFKYRQRAGLAELKARVNGKRTPLRIERRRRRRG